jgi:hypothetical protein
LQQFPFISYKILCRKLKIGKSACSRVLHDNLHLEKFNLRYVPHSLQVDQKRRQWQPKNSFTVLILTDINSRVDPGSEVLEPVDMIDTELSKFRIKPELAVSHFLILRKHRT